MLVKQLKKHFPSFEIKILDVRELFTYKIYLIINLFFIIKEYGLEILLGKKDIRNYFWRTTYIFKIIKFKIFKNIPANQYAFSIQTQSLFDASIKGLPHFVYTDHTHLENLHYTFFDKSKLCSKAWIELESTIYKNAAINFTMSNNISKSLIKQYFCPPEKIVCIYAGNNTSVDRVDNDYINKNILFVGIDWERKGGPDLVEAFKIVLRFCPDAKLTIVGCSPKVNIKNCEVVGKVGLQETANYYRKASVFCLPTKIEPFGIVFIEAMAFKLPVIGTRIGAIPDFIFDRENGYLIEPGDIKQLATALIDLISNPEKCRDFGKKGAEIINSRYSWDKVGIALKKNIGPLISKEY